MIKIELFPNDIAERIQKRMICHYKRYSVLTFILRISFFDVIFNFPYFRIYQFLRAFSFYEHRPHFLFVTLKVTLVRTKSTHGQSLAKNYGAFSMVQMSLWKMQVLVTVGVIQKFLKKKIIVSRKKGVKKYYFWNNLNGF